MKITSSSRGTLMTPVIGLLPFKALNGWFGTPLHLDGAQWDQLLSDGHPGRWTPRRDPVIELIDGSVIKGAVDARILFGDGNTVVSSASRVAIIDRWPISNWPFSSLDDLHYPSNPLFSAKAALAPRMDYRGESNLIHGRPEGSLRLSGRRGRRWVTKWGSDWLTTKYGWDLPTYSRLIAWADTEEDADALLADWPLPDNPIGPYKLGGPYMWALLDEYYAINAWDSPYSLYGKTDLLDVLNRIGSGFTLTQIHSEGIVAYEVSDFVFDHNGENRADWSYSLIVTVNGGATFTGRWAIKSGYSLVPTNMAAVPPGWRQPLALLCRPYYEAQLIYGTVHYGLGLSETTELRPVAGALDVPLTLASWQRCGPFVSGLPSLDLRDGTYLAGTEYRKNQRHFVSAMDTVMPELRRTAIYAVLDAVHQRMKAIETNHLETLSELEGILDVVPDFKKLSHLLRVAPWGKVGAGVVSLGKWAAGAHLQYLFGTRPTVDAIAELDRLGPKLASYLDAALSVKTQRNRGSFSFSYTTEDAISIGLPPILQQPLRLTTRATVDMRYPESTLVLALTQLYSLGLAPTASNLWETLPGSFVVDWATNLGSRIHDVDLAVYAMMAEFSSIIVSYAVETDDFVVLGSPDFDVSSNVYWRYYRRELLTSLPSFAEGSIDYRRAAGSPPWSTVAALFVQLSPDLR